MQEKAVVAITTPPGKGGIASVRISGENVFQVAQKVFQSPNLSKKLERMEGYTAAYGHFVRNNKVKDECIALVFKAPRSYTGEDVVEISCHGGSAVSNELLNACIEAGAVPAGPGEFTKRAFLNGKLSLTQAEAVMDLISATSRQGVAAAASALEGALYKRIQQNCIIPLTELMGHVAAYTDFPEEEVSTIEETEIQTTLHNVQKQLEQLIVQYDAGAVLRRGVDTVIIGSPNVGKSTLLNLLSGYERAIVTPIPGTTRDVIEQSVSIGGIELLLADTAGIRKTDNLVEKEGINRAYKRVEKAGLIIAVFDASEPLNQEQVDLAENCKGRAALAVINKIDLVQKLKQEDIAPYFKKVIAISANNSQFLQEVEQGVLEVVGVSNIDPDAGLLANARQLSAAKTAQQAVQDAINTQSQGFTLDVVGICIDDALTALFELTGESASEAVVEEVFSKFCVGK